MGEIWVKTGIVWCTFYPNAFIINQRKEFARIFWKQFHTLKKLIFTWNVSITKVVGACLYHFFLLWSYCSKLSDFTSLRQFGSKLIFWQHFKYDESEKFAKYLMVGVEHGSFFFASGAKVHNLFLQLFHQILSDQKLSNTSNAIYEF